MADLVVLDLENIGQLQAEPKLALDMPQRVLLTLVDGQTTYTAPGFAPQSPVHGGRQQADFGKRRWPGRGVSVHRALPSSAG